MQRQLGLLVCIHYDRVQFLYHMLPRVKKRKKLTMVMHLIKMTSLQTTF